MDLIKNIFMIKCLVLMITFSIDMVMIYVLYKKIVYDTYDKIFIYMIFVCHVVFVVAVIGDVQKILGLYAYMYIYDTVICDVFA